MLGRAGTRGFGDLAARLLAAAGGAAPGAFVVSEMQLSGDKKRCRAVLAFVVDHGMRTARLVSRRGLAGRRQLGVGARQIDLVRSRRVLVLANIGRRFG